MDASPMQPLSRSKRLRLVYFKCEEDWIKYRNEIRVEWLNSDGRYAELEGFTFETVRFERKPAIGFYKQEPDTLVAVLRHERTRELYEYEIGYDQTIVNWGKDWF